MNNDCVLYEAKLAKESGKLTRAGVVVLALFEKITERFPWVQVVEEAKQ